MKNSIIISIYGGEIVNIISTDDTEITVVNYDRKDEGKSFIKELAPDDIMDLRSIRDTIQSIRNEEE